MKKQLLIFCTVFFLIACSSDEEPSVPQTILGNWQLTASFDGGPQGNGLLQIENGRTYNFDTDGIITSNSRDCDGTFSYDDNTIEVDFPCFGFTTYDYEFIEGKLKLTEQESSCDEGCYTLYTKID